MSKRKYDKVLIKFHPEYDQADADGSGVIQPVPACPFHMMPAEILARIFSYLEINDVARCSCVCARWRCVGQSVLMQRSVIFDLDKWAKCVWQPGPSRQLKRMVTGATRRLIMRKPLYFPPENLAAMPLQAFRDPASNLCYCNSSLKDLHRIFLHLNNHLYKIFNNREMTNSSGNAMHRGPSLTLQNLRIAVSSLFAYNLNSIREVRLQNVQLDFFFGLDYDKQYKDLDFPLRVSVVEHVITQDNMWLFDTDGKPVLREPAYLKELPHIAAIFYGLTHFMFFDLLVPTGLSPRDLRIVETKLRSKDTVGDQYMDYWICGISSKHG
ncbi:uncharacterized protein LOC129596528 isoform X2 [Paramacrobiotus metropolitanus]|uniref:uncharacterized protein LOC129596528 isoform X2 n=1 Tax=Paramacrobiotus metropolitanus TaxID=2943436 RepID=UPI002446540C|nr:uncharacterized protein LOC129596528 isoform X2 [Paramacrobiotus metropolitanus]